METIQVQNISIEDLRLILAEVFEEKVKPLLPPPKQKTSNYLTRKETAELLGISLVTLHTWTKKGILKSYKLNSCVRYRDTEVEKVISNKLKRSS